MKRATFSALALSAAVFTIPAFAADPAVTFCKDELASVLSLHGMQLSDLQDVEQIKVGRQQPSIVTIGRPSSCASGELQITMWYTCTLQSMYTVGDCKLKGVSSAPF